jgi:hypothetical protein
VHVPPRADAGHAGPITKNLLCGGPDGGCPDACGKHAGWSESDDVRARKTDDGCTGCGYGFGFGFGSACARKRRTCVSPWIRVGGGEVMRMASDEAMWTEGGGEVANTKEIVKSVPCSPFFRGESMQKMTSVRLTTAQLSNAKQAVVIECLRYQHASREKESSTDKTLNKKETKKKIRQSI